MKKSFLLGASCAVLLTAPAQAQLLIGTSNYVTGEHYHVDMTTGVGTPMLAGWVNTQGGGDTDIVGMTADDANCTLYIAQTNGVGSYIYEWIYNDPQGPQLILTNPIDMTSAGQIRSEGIAFANGILYVIDEFGGGGAAEGIYSVDIPTNIATLEYAFAAPATTNIGGLCYNPANGLFYGVDDDNFVSMSFDIVNDTEAVVGAYPTGVTDIDACVIDDTGTTLYLIEDNASNIHTYDLATGTYAAMPFPSPVVSAWTFSASAWAPGFDPAGAVCTPGLGTPYCGPAVANSSGNSAFMSADGSAVVMDNDVTLTANDLPLASFGFFLTSTTQGNVPQPGGSQGVLCLGGNIGRYVGPGQIQNSGAVGAFSLTIDLTQHPTPTGIISVAAGQTWNFQAWFRDAVSGAATSNFTDGLEIAFQ